MNDKWKEVTNAVIAKELIKNVSNLLNAEVHYKTLLDSRGVMKKCIEITYEDEETKTSSKK